MNFLCVLTGTFVQFPNFSHLKYQWYFAPPVHVLLRTQPQTTRHTTLTDPALLLSPFLPHNERKVRFSNGPAPIHIVLHTGWYPCFIKQGRDGGIPVTSNRGKGVSLFCPIEEIGVPVFHSTWSREYSMFFQQGDRYILDSSNRELRDTHVFGQQEGPGVPLFIHAYREHLFHPMGW